MLGYDHDQHMVWYGVYFVGMYKFTTIGVVTNWIIVEYVTETISCFL